VGRNSCVLALLRTYCVRSNRIVSMSVLVKGLVYLLNAWDECTRRPLRGNKATLFQGGVRGTGFLWGKMLTQPGRLSSVMMHNIDWGPTLISAAGGDGNALTKNDTLKLDGVDCWDAIALTPGKSHSPPRNSILLHLVGPPDGDMSTHVARGYP
jgi:arylsulfatase A-like enzyme